MSRLEEEYNTPMEQSLVDDNEFRHDYENGFDATFELKSQFLQPTFCESYCFRDPHLLQENNSPSR